MHLTTAKAARQSTRQPFRLGGAVFKTKKEATERIQQILRGAMIGWPLQGDDLALVSALFDMHPDRAEKAGPGVAGFCVKLNQKEGYVTTRGFHVIHPNGTTTDWSYRVCMNLRLSVPTFEGAARNAILLSQRIVKATPFIGRETIACPMCGKVMRREEAHVHHMPPTRFRDMLKAWRDMHGEPEVVADASGFGDDFANPAVKRAFLAWHDATAKRIVICGPCNLAAG